MNPTTNLTIHLPMTLLCLGLSLFLFAQVTSIGQGARSLKWQIESATTQIKNLEESGTKLRAAVDQRETLVKQAAQVKAQYTELLNDVLELAKTDADAQKVVQKWNIRQQPPAASPSPTPEAETP